MPFSFKMQPYLVDRFYHYLRQEGISQEQALNGVMVAFKRHATLWGYRSAQRAVRDNKPLTFANYKAYRELLPTPELRERDGSNQGMSTVTESGWTGITYECPTGHQGFVEFGSPIEIERLFCTYVDRFDVEGFNSDIDYQVELELGDSPVRCVHHCKNCGLKPGEVVEQAPDTPPYPFLMASGYYTMSEVITAIFEEKGERVCQQVRADFIQRYGADTWAEVEQYEGANFALYYPKAIEHLKK